jgi:hypothetical protein
MPEKRYTPEGLEILDNPLESIRRRPGIYLGSVELRGEALSGRLVDDVTCISQQAVAVLQHAGWWIVACEEDWVEMNCAHWLERRRISGYPELTGGIECYFRNVVPFLERRANYFHGELLLTAFAESVMTATADGERTQIVGSVPMEGMFDAVTRSLPYWRRLVAFRLKG